MKEMRLEAIKSFLLQLEAEKKTNTTEEVRVQRVYGDSQQASENKCYRCNGAGNWAKDCRLKNTDKWFCYVCQAIKYHKGTECPQISSGSNDKNNRDKRYKNYNSNKNNKSKSTHESVAKNKSKSEQQGFKIKKKEN